MYAASLLNLPVRPDSISHIYVWALLMLYSPAVEQLTSVWLQRHHRFHASENNRLASRVRRKRDYHRNGSFVWVITQPKIFIRSRTCYNVMTAFTALTVIALILWVLQHQSSADSADIWPSFLSALLPSGGAMWEYKSFTVKEHTANLHYLKIFSDRSTSGLIWTCYWVCLCLMKWWWRLILFSDLSGRGSSGLDGLISVLDHKRLPSAHCRAPAGTPHSPVGLKTTWEGRALIWTKSMMWNFLVVVPPHWKNRFFFYNHLRKHDISPTWRHTTPIQQHCSAGWSSVWLHRHVPSPRLVTGRSPTQRLWLSPQGLHRSFFFKFLSPQSRVFFSHSWNWFHSLNALVDSSCALVVSDRCARCLKYHNTTAPCVR